jgi:hypothetical protein
LGRASSLAGSSCARIGMPSLSLFTAMTGALGTATLGPSVCSSL